MIPDGGFRLHWDDADGIHLYEDAVCLHDALEKAAEIYGMSRGTLTRLENWLGEDACPAEQLLFAAKLRSDDVCDRHAQRAEQYAMEANPLYGIFS